MTQKAIFSAGTLPLALSLAALIPGTTPAAEFTYKLVDDSFQQLWSNPIYWELVSGVDDGAGGYPDGEDTFTFDRSTTTSASTRLAIEGGPPFEVGGIVAKGGPNRDIVLKFGDFTLGDLEVQESVDPLVIQSERDRNFTITGVISGSGDLELQRLGGFSDGVDPDELTTITGEEPNSFTGTMRLYNSSGNGQPAYWVADKVGAFGEASALTLEGRLFESEVAQLQITANAMGGEGAIDDDATTVMIGPEGVLSVDAGVDELIGEGKLMLDLEGTGTPTVVPNGTYTSSEDWIIGEGTITVGPAPNLGGLQITEVSYSTGNEGPSLSLTWVSTPGQSYAVSFSTDLTTWDGELEQSTEGDAGETTTREYLLSDFPALDGESTVFFRVEERE